MTLELHWERIELERMSRKRKKKIWTPMTKTPQKEKATSPKNWNSDAKRSRTVSQPNAPETNANFTSQNLNSKIANWEPIETAFSKSSTICLSQNCAFAARELWWTTRVLSSTPFLMNSNPRWWVLARLRTTPAMKGLLGSRTTSCRCSCLFALLWWVCSCSGMENHPITFVRLFPRCSLMLSIWVKHWFRPTPTPFRIHV